MIGPAEWNYLPRSEERIVSQLIYGRSKLESLKGNPDILCTLIDLDR